ncbi:MAG TPA: SIS domain-containing protein [Devosia sp.]|nr:SIS domain-containing protein [Devosia sp.]
MLDTTTHMHNEVAEIPQAIQRFLALSGDMAGQAAEALKARNPALITTIARGSSDHACAFLKYAIELYAGVPVASLGPSIASIYGAKLRLQSAATILVSQSGRSPDIIAMAEAARDGGALALALTNNPTSPLAASADHAIDIAAGPELSVAATKTFVSSIVAGLAVLGKWQGDHALLQALADLPGHAEKALSCDWSPLSEALDAKNSFYVLGRGPSWAIAQEVALKFKETCSLHAEAYSAAEVMHGPVELVASDFPVLALCARDAAEQSSVAAAEKIADTGAQVFLTSRLARNSTKLPFVATGHPLTDALCLVIPYYVFVEAYSRHLGLNPDKPARLNKVTRTR